MDRGRAGRTLAGFAVAAGLLAALAWLVGVRAFLAALSRAEPAGVAAVVGLAVAWLASWGLALRAVLGALGVRVSAAAAVLAYAGAAFANNVTPFGQAGGEPAAALVVREAAAVPYEEGLAAVASVDALNVVPSVGIALTGAGLLATTATLSPDLAVAAGAVAAVGLAAALVGALAWRSRGRLAGAAARLLTPALVRATAALPGAATATRAGIAARVDGFVAAVERVAADRRRLAVALGCSAAGWLCQVAALWVAVRAVGGSVPVALAAVAVPVSVLAAAAPLPGGLGGIEGALVGVLVAGTGSGAGGGTAGLPAATALAAIVLFRGTIYWLPTLSGGLVAGVVAAGQSARKAP